jgi:hypothetical protein
MFISACNIYTLYMTHYTLQGAGSSIVVEALSYKPEGRGFETRCADWILSVYLILNEALGPEVYSTSDRNGYHRQTKKK